MILQSTNVIVLDFVSEGNNHSFVIWIGWTLKKWHVTCSLDMSVQYVCTCICVFEQEAVPKCPILVETKVQK